MQDWTRAQLWAEHDARHARALRGRSVVLGIAALCAWLGITLMSYACHVAYLEGAARSRDAPACMVDARAR